MRRCSSGLIREWSMPVIAAAGGAAAVVAGGSAIDWLVVEAGGPEGCDAQAAKPAVRARISAGFVNIVMGSPLRIQTGWHRAWVGGALAALSKKSEEQAQAGHQVPTLDDVARIAGAT